MPSYVHFLVTCYQQIHQTYFATYYCFLTLLTRKASSLKWPIKGWNDRKFWTKNTYFHDYLWWNYELSLKTLFINEIINPFYTLLHPFSHSLCANLYSPCRRKWHCHVDARPMGRSLNASCRRGRGRRRRWSSCRSLACRMSWRVVLPLIRQMVKERGLRTDRKRGEVISHLHKITPDKSESDLVRIN